MKIILLLMVITLICYVLFGVSSPLQVVEGVVDFAENVTNLYDKAMTLIPDWLNPEKLFPWQRKDGFADNAIGGTISGSQG